MLPTDRAGYVHGGELVEFRLNTTDELLWEASHQFLPQKDDRLFYAVGGGPFTEYEVVAVKFEYRKVMIHPEPPEDPVEVPTGLCDCTPVVLLVQP